MWRYHCILLFWSYTVVLTKRTVPPEVTCGQSKIFCPIRIVVVTFPSWAPSKSQRYFPLTKATTRFLFCYLLEFPHVSWCHWLQSAANFELSSFILTNEPHAFGEASVWPLKYCTSASPLLLAAVVKWQVRPFFCCSGISIEWKTIVFSVPSWHLSWVTTTCCDNCLFHGMMIVWEQ